MDKIQPVYLGFGPETFLMEEYLDAFMKKHIEPEHRDFAVSRFDLAETPLDVVLDEAEMAPFMVPLKIVIAGNAYFFTGARESGKVEHRVDRLAEYIKSPAEHTVLFFTVGADKLDERKKIVKTFKERKWTVPFQSLSPEQLGDWVVRRAKKLDFTFSDNAEEQLILYTGGHLQMLVSELEKISLYAGAGGTATPDLVDRLVVRSTEQNVFIFIDHLVRMRLDQAFGIFYELLKQKEEPIKIVMLMARQFRMILQVKDLTAQGYSQQQIAGLIGAHPYPVKLAAEQGRKYSIVQLNGILSKLAELDFGIKSGKTDKTFGLEMLMLSLAPQSAVR